MERRSLQGRKFPGMESNHAMPTGAGIPEVIYRLCAVHYLVTAG